MKGLILEAIREQDLTSPNFIYILFETVALVIKTFKVDS
jgi:hypothetical protein